MPSRMWHDAQARSGVGKTAAGDGTCTADSSSESIPSRTPPRNLRGYGLPTTAFLPDTHGLQAQPRMGQAVAEMELAQPILQRIYAFPDTATKPAWLRPSDKYIPSRTCMARKDDLERGKPTRNMKDATARKFSPIQTLCTQTPFTHKSTERGYCLTPYPLGYAPLASAK